MTNPEDRKLLLAIARDAIDAQVTGGSKAVIATGDLSTRLGGAFVSIHCRGELRGCIGHLEANRPLAHVVAQCAVSASTTDPRFPPITLAELNDMEVELSLLGPLEAITGPQDIEVGRHGLLVERGGRRGLLLPQVATEWNWDAATFLAHTCRKAGFAADAWKHDATLWRFEAEVFGEATAPAVDR